MIHHRQIEHARIFQRPAHQIVVLHAVAVVGNRDDAGRFERADGGEFLPRNIARDGARHKKIDAAFSGGPFMNQRHRPRVVDGGGGIGHAHHRGKPAARRRRGPGGDGLLGRLSGFAQMRVQINQPRAHHQSRCVEPARAVGRARDEAGADGADLAIHNKNVGHGIQAVGGVQDAATGDKQGIHRGKRIHRRIDNASEHATMRVWRGCSSMVEREPSKLHTRVRFPSPAPTATRTYAYSLAFSVSLVPNFQLWQQPNNSRREPVANRRGALHSM